MTSSAGKFSDLRSDSPQLAGAAHGPRPFWRGWGVWRARCIAFASAFRLASACHAPPEPAPRSIVLDVGAAEVFDSGSNLVRGVVG